MDNPEGPGRGPSKGRWAEAVERADATGDASMLVALLLDPSVEVDRHGLAELLSRKALRNQSKRPRSIPVAERNELVTRTYREAREAGLSADEACAAAGEAVGIGADSARNIVRRHR